MNDTHELAGKPTSIPALTSLRFAAAFAVMLLHYFYQTSLTNPVLKHFLEHFNAGVSFFFVLSGFILVYTYYDRFTTNLSFIGSFAKTRFARIYPVYFVVF